MSTPLINPFQRFRVSAGWSDAHPGVDYATPIGTPFVAPADGIYRRRVSQLERTFGMAGHYGDLILSSGDRIRFCHLDRHIAASGARVFIGESVLAETGNTGYVIPFPTRANPHNGAHMHTTGFRANGGRWNWTLDVGGSPAGSEEDMPITDEDAMRVAKAILDQSFINRTVDGKTVAVPIRSEIAEAKTNAILANAGIAALRGDWQQGIAGVQNAGRLYLLLAKASAGEIDEAQLARELAPLLEVNVEALSDESIAQLAKAVNDEEDRRARERLG